MIRRRRALLAFVAVAALATPAPTALAEGRAKAKARAERAARGKRLQRAANRLVSLIRRTRPLAGLMSKRVTVTYETNDRYAGSFKGKVVVDAAKVDGVVAVKGMTGGVAWVPKERKIKPRPRTVQLNAGKQAYELLRLIREAGRRHDLIEVHKRDLTLYLEFASELMIFKFRDEGAAGMRVYELGYSNDDPG